MASHHSYDSSSSTSLNVIGKLVVRIESAHDLKIGDFFTSDPYVVVRYGKHQIYKTKVKNMTCNPKWGEEFCIQVVNPKIPVVFEVYDSDLIKYDDCLGTASIDIATLEPNQFLAIHSVEDASAHPIWLKNIGGGCACGYSPQLTKKNDVKLRGVKTGALQLSLLYVPTGLPIGRKKGSRCRPTLGAATSGPAAISTTTSSIVKPATDNKGLIGMLQRLSKSMVSHH